MKEFLVDTDITRARTLPASFYRSQSVYDALTDRVLARSWQLVGHGRDLERAGSARPFVLLPGSLDEPLVLTRDLDGGLHCLSNVCSHRGNIVQAHAGDCRALRCRYHGRRFALDGTLKSMPEFEGVEGFPARSDDLPSLSMGELGGLLFASLDPLIPFDELVDPIREMVERFPMEDLRFDATRSRDYLVQAHWALYVDNYLEGFHIPYVHPELAACVDYETYRTVIHPWSNVQIAAPRGDAPTFDAGASLGEIAASYVWLFPNTMLNFYPWGLSVNIVQPLAPDRTKVSFLTYVARPELIDEGAGGSLDKVQREDEEVVEDVQRGIRSRLYRSGRFSPTREEAVHQFHCLLGQALTDAPPARTEP